MGLKVNGKIRRCSHGSALSRLYHIIPIITAVTFHVCHRSRRKMCNIQRGRVNLWGSSPLIPRDAQEINRPVPFNFNFRAWYILWSPVTCGACALEREAEWILIALYQLPCALHPSAIRQTRAGDNRGSVLFFVARTLGQMCGWPRYGGSGLLWNTARPCLTLWPWRVKDARMRDGRRWVVGGDTERKNRWHFGRDFAGFPRCFGPVWIRVGVRAAFINVSAALKPKPVLYQGHANG